MGLIRSAVLCIAHSWALRCIAHSWATSFHARLHVHRNIEGEWVDADEVPRDPLDGRIIAYVARSGHGVYPKVR